MFIGGDSPLDRFPTPDGEKLGVEIHANAAATILDGETVTRAPWWVFGATVLLGPMLILVFLTPGSSWRRFTLVGAGALALQLAGLWIMARLLIVTSALWPLVATLSVVAAWGILSMSRGRHRAHETIPGTTQQGEADRDEQPRGEDGEEVTIACPTVQVMALSPDGAGGDSGSCQGTKQGARAGMRIGNYVIIRLLGKGGMGSVYLATNPEIEREVAIKILDQVHDTKSADRFVNEAWITIRINHPNIIDIYDLGRTREGWIYYVMEMLEGCELLEVMNAIFEREGRMLPADVLPYLEQICGALAAAHEMNVVHRDLKPQNIFVVKRDPLVLKVLDFGLAKLLERKEEGAAFTQRGVLMGTPLVIAPEQAQGQIDAITARTDLYSLGVILYWMLAGRPPFNNTTAALVLVSHIKETPPLLSELQPSLPPAIVTLVMQCLEKAPGKRPASAREVSMRFAAALNREAAAMDGFSALGVTERHQAVGTQGDGARSHSSGDEEASAPPASPSSTED